MSEAAQEASLDLSTERVRAFLRERAPRLEKAARCMEAVETWTLDKLGQIQDLLHALGERVQEVDFGRIDDAVHNHLIMLMGYVNSSKVLRLLLWIDGALPNFVAKTLAQAELIASDPRNNTPDCKLLVERFDVLERMHLLSRVFAEVRIGTVFRALQLLRGELKDLTDEHGEHGEDDTDNGRSQHAGEA